VGKILFITMVDYSKWDRMNYGENDDDEEMDSVGPRVTTLDQPGRVTIGPEGCTLEPIATASTATKRGGEGSAAGSTSVPSFYSSSSSSSSSLSTMLNDLPRITTTTTVTPVASIATMKEETDNVTSTSTITGNNNHNNIHMYEPRSLESMMTKGSSSGSSSTSFSFPSFSSSSSSSLSATNNKSIDTPTAAAAAAALPTTHEHCIDYTTAATSTTTKAITTLFDSANDDVAAYKRQRYIDRITRNGGECRAAIINHTTATSSTKTTNTTNNTNAFPPIGLPPLSFYWCQDRSIVEIRLAFPSTLFSPKSIRVRVVGALPYVDRNSAVGRGHHDDDVADNDYDDNDDNVDMMERSSLISSSSYGSIEVTSHNSSSSSSSSSTSTTILLAGKLPRPIHLHENDDDIDYNIEDYPLDNINEDNGLCVIKCDRVLVITLPKATPMVGMTIWWDRPLVGYPRIHVGDIEDRTTNILSTKKKSMTNNANKHNNSNINNDDDVTMVTATKNPVYDDDEKINNDGGAAFRKAWDEAHDAFRKKAQTREKQIIDV